MITIRSSNISSEVALICLEPTLATRRGVYTISSDGPMIDSASPSGGGLFGAISWPRSRFRLADGLSLEQQMFLPHDGSALRSPGQSGATHLLQRSLSLGHSFPVAARAPIAISVFALSRSRKAAGSPGCRMCEGQKLLRTRTADITMNQHDRSIVFAVKQQRRLHLTTRSRREALSLSYATGPQC